MTALAQPYTLEKKSIDGMDVYALNDAGRGMEALVAPALGMNSYSMRVHGKPVFWFPHAGPGEARTKGGMFGNPLLWPWANRIDGMTYTVNGKKYLLNPELGNVRPGPNNTPIHGLLVREEKWAIAASGADRNSAWLRARLEYFRRPELMAQFPFAHTIEIEYRLAGGALEITTTIENMAADPMPVALGYHPYFTITDTPRDGWKARLPAKQRYLLSPRLIPTGETGPNPHGGEVSLKGIVLDDVFGALERDADGFARFSVMGAKQKITVEYGPGYEVAVVYAPAGRDFICFEPMTSITNAFNAANDGWYKGLQTVAPGAVWKAVFRVRPENFD